MSWKDTHQPHVRRVAAGLEEHGVEGHLALAHLAGMGAAMREFTDEGWELLIRRDEELEKITFLDPWMPQPADVDPTTGVRREVVRWTLVAARRGAHELIVDDQPRMR